MCLVLFEFPGGLCGYLNSERTNDDDDADGGGGDDDDRFCF